MNADLLAPVAAVAAAPDAKQPRTPLVVLWLLTASAAICVLAYLALSVPARGSAAHRRCTRQRAN